MTRKMYKAELNIKKWVLLLLHAFTVIIAVLKTWSLKILDFYLTLHWDLMQTNAKCNLSKQIKDIVRT